MPTLPTLVSAAVVVDDTTYHLAPSGDTECDYGEVASSSKCR